MFAFTHQDAKAVDEFLVITTASGQIRLTPDHYIFVNGNLVPAAQIVPGNALTKSDGSLDTVISVFSELGLGLYNPHTLSGRIAVVCRSCSSCEPLIDCNTSIGWLPSLHLHDCIASPNGAFTSLARTCHLRVPWHQRSRTIRSPRFQSHPASRFFIEFISLIIGRK